MEPAQDVQGQNPAPVVPTTPAPAAPVAPVAPATPAPVVTEQQPVGGLPTETRDRTREQFEKLLDNNRRLFEANEVLRRQMDQRNNANQTFDPIQRVTQTPQGASPQINPADFVETDPVTGATYVNTDKMSAQWTEIQKRATRAEQAIQSYIQTNEQREIDRQNKEAFTAYPELDPLNPKFDQSMHKLVRGALYDSMNFADENGGKPFTFKEAADWVRAQFPKPAMTPSPTTTETAQATAQAAQAAQEAQALKEQSAAAAVSQPRGKVEISDAEELERLRYLTRYEGNDDALARRIANTDHVRKDADA